MTGPTSTRSSAVLPTRSSPMAPCSISTTRSAASSCTHSTRRPQRWPALSKADDTASPTPARPGRRVHDHRVLPTRFGNQRNGAACGISRRPRCVQDAGDFGEPVNITPSRGIANQARHGPPWPGSSCTAAGAHACHSGRPRRRSAVCSARLASTGLPAASAAPPGHEDGEREVQGLMQATRAQRDVGGVVEGVCTWAQ